MFEKGVEMEWRSIESAKHKKRTNFFNVKISSHWNLSFEETDK